MSRTCIRHVLLFMDPAWSCLICRNFFGVLNCSETNFLLLKTPMWGLPLFTTTKTQIWSTVLLHSPASCRSISTKTLFCSKILTQRILLSGLLRHKRRMVFFKQLFEPLSPQASFHLSLCGMDWIWLLSNRASHESAVSYWLTWETLECSFWCILKNLVEQMPGIIYAAFKPELIT